MKNDLSSPLLPRRQFLVLGSAAVATVAATSLSADIVRSALVIEDTAPRLSVGFAAATLEDFSKPSFASWVTGASKLRSGDSSLANGVRLQIHGFIRPEEARDQQVNLALDAMYRVDGRSETVPFMAWSHARIGRNTMASSPRSFVIPVNAKQPLSLAVSSSATNVTSGNAKMTGTISLAVGSGRRENKLRTGVYFVAICPSAAKTPDWASIQAVALENSSLPVLQQATLTGLKPVTFDYIVFTADRA